jgi:hypothetical protein
MLRRCLFAISFLAMAGAAFAQVPIDERFPQDVPVAQAPTPKPGRVQPTPVPAPLPPPGRGDLPLEAARKIRGKDVNVQVEITITDQSGTAAPDRKVVTLLAADQTMGRVRANAHAQQANVGMVGTELNVDARPIVMDNDRILLELTLEYSPLRQSPVTQQPTNLNEQISVILQNGKSLTISQAADPVSDRKMTVEVKATVLK